MINQNLLLTGDDGYNLTNSLRFRSSASAYLNRTPASATNRKTWTWSAWVKRSELSSNQSLFAVNATGDYQEFRFTASNTLQLILDAAANNYAVEVPTVVWRDVSAWYHIVLAVDTTQATSTNRVKIYVNGIQQTVSAVSGFSFPAQNFDTYVNATLPHAIGNFNYLNSLYFNGYMTEINLIDGQALTPSSFGETSLTTGVWIPKKYTGTYGTNGFYLPFTDNSALTTSSNVGLGKDFSGNANYWTTNNISITAGTTYDSMTDVPTLTSTTAANYCVLNPLDKNSNLTLSDGNLTAIPANISDYYLGRASMAFPTTGKYYWELTLNNTPYLYQAGIYSYNRPLSGSVSGTGNEYQVAFGTAFTYIQYQSNNVAFAAWGTNTNPTSGDVLMFAFDADNSTMWIGRNGTWYNTSGTANPATNTDPRFSSIPTGLFSGVNMPNPASDGVSLNFGQRPFAYTPPSGFNRLNTFNLPTPTIGATASTLAGKYMNVVTYTGTGSSLSVTGVGFQPDWTWIKGRSGATDHGLYDAVRGVQKQLESNTTDSETTETTGLTAFGSDGFTVGALAQLNTSSATYVGWNWKANGAGSSNTAGSITSTVSANTSAGFSIVTYTGNGTSGATVGHGLGVAPSMIIVKVRDVAGYEWNVYHSAIGATNWLELNATTASQAGSNRWNDTAPTSSVFSLGNANVVNQNTKTYVAYCFTPIAGYSAFGSYTANGSTDGSFIYTGFRPRFVMTKKTNSTSGWGMVDTSINPYNQATTYLQANTSNAVVGGTSSNGIDIVSNGFKIRSTDGSFNDTNGDTYIYMAFAENPFKYANAR
jgi:hypothetical protein